MELKLHQVANLKGKRLTTNVFFYVHHVQKIVCRLEVTTLLYSVFRFQIIKNKQNEKHYCHNILKYI